MKSVARTLIDGFGIDARFIPAASEDVIIGLIATLAKHDLLEEAVQEVLDNTDQTFSGNIEELSQVARVELLPYLFRSDMAVNLIIQLTPFLETMGSVISIQTGIKGNLPHYRRVISKGLKIINDQSNNLKLYLPHGSTEEVVVIKYGSREELLRTLQDLDLPSVIRDPLAW